jgi:hypothetical protein
MMIFMLLAEMMRLGYAASELLRIGIVAETDDSSTILPPDLSEMRRVLTGLQSCDK